MEYLISKKIKDKKFVCNRNLKKLRKKEKGTFKR